MARNGRVSDGGSVDAGDSDGDGTGSVMPPLAPPQPPSPPPPARQRLPWPPPRLAEDDGAAMLHAVDDDLPLAAAACTERTRSVALVIAVIVTAIIVGTLLGQAASGLIAQFEGSIGWFTGSSAPA